MRLKSSVLPLEGLEKTRPNKTPGVSIWQERVLGIGIGVENLALLMSALIQSRQ